MMPRSHLFRALWVVLTLVAAPKFAVAQDQGRIEVAGGYFMMDDYDSDMTFPGGWFGSLGVDVAGPVAAVRRGERQLEIHVCHGITVWRGCGCVGQQSYVHGRAASDVAGQSRGAIRPDALWCLAACELG